MIIKYLTLLLAVFTFGCSAQSAVLKNNADAKLNLIPWPKKIEMNGKMLALKDSTRIVTKNTELLPLAELLSDELFALTGKRFEYGKGKPEKNDIGLALSKNKNAPEHDESYKLIVTDKVVVAGGNYNSVTMGTATLLQAIKSKAGKVYVPCMKVSDNPDKWYRGLLLDVARRYNSIEDLKQSVILCRLYKIPFLHIHLSDDHGWTFPSKAFPKAGSANYGFRGRSPEVYDIDELKALVDFAAKRGVILIPEIDVPAHTGALRKCYPDVFDIANGGPASLGILNMANEEAYKGLDTIMGEVLEVFHTTPYFHVGADEADPGQVKRATKYYEPYMKKHGLKNPHELYLHCVMRMDELVKKYGKRTIVWGGDFHISNEKLKLPSDVILMSWRNGGAGGAKNYIDNGHDIINATWRPLYVVNQTKDTIQVVEDARDKHRPETIFDWHLLKFNTTKLEPSDKIIGSQLCVWEQGGEANIPALRDRLPAMSERVWDVDGKRSWADFSKRFKATDKLLDEITFPFKAKVSPIVSPNKWAAPPLDGFYVGNNPTCACEPLIPGLTLRYITKDEHVPADAPILPKSLALDGIKEISVQAFDANGKKVGQRWYRVFTQYLIVGQFKGLIVPELPKVIEQGTFEETATIEMLGSAKVGKLPFEFKGKVGLALKALAKGTIRYTLDGSTPTKDSEEYKKPIVTSDSVAIRAALFNSDGKILGQVWSYPTLKNVTPMPNLTLGKSTMTFDMDGNQLPNNNGPNAVDGIVDREIHWGIKAPAAFQIDLEKVYNLKKVQVFPYWDSRHYKYTVELSEDGKNWTKVVDRSNNTERATSQGHTHKFKATPARYVRVNMISNSANIAVHLAEVRVFDSKNTSK